MKDTKNIELLVIGGGTAATNAARSATKAGAKDVLVIHPDELTNTCVEEGCMPSKSLLAGAHMHMSLEQVMKERNEHVNRLMKALKEGFKSEAFQITTGIARFEKDGLVSITDGEDVDYYLPEKVIIATGSKAFVPPIKGLDTIGDKMLVSNDIVSIRSGMKEIPKRVLVLGGGPVGLEMATFLHDMGSDVEVIERGESLKIFDPEFGKERVRASMDPKNFPIYTNTSLTSIEKGETCLRCSLVHDDETKDKEYDAILVATGRKPNIKDLGLENTKVTLDERGNIKHDEHLETEHGGIFVAGDVTGHHQILHYAAEMGKVAGYNAATKDGKKVVDYDKFMLGVSFDQFPSALIGITETEAKKRGIDVITSTRNFNSIGLGILKRQEYGIWKIVAEKETGKIIGSQIVGPPESGELIQLLVPIIHNGNTYGDILNMPWYHPTFAEILKSLANDLCKQDNTFCPGV